MVPVTSARRLVQVLQSSESVLHREEYKGGGIVFGRSKDTTPHRELRAALGDLQLLAAIHSAESPENGTRYRIIDMACPPASRISGITSGRWPLNELARK